VFTAGGAQNLMKGYGVLPGRRVLIAGSGPLLFAVAHYLLHGGATVVAICEASPMRRVWRYGLRMLAHLDFVQQGYRYRQEIKEAGVPFLAGHVVRRALAGRRAEWLGAGKSLSEPSDPASGGVSSVVVSRCGDDWTPIDGTEQTFDVDALVVGYGFVSSLELSRLAGCQHTWDAALGGWVPVRTRDMESTAPGVFVVGDGAGVAGSSVALEEGHLAGLAVAGRLGRLTGRQYSREISRAHGRLLHLAGFRRVMDELYCFGPGIYTLAESETTLCRCEEVTIGEALAAMREGASHANEVKAWTRVGMGRCQGRMCGPALAHLIARATGRPVSDGGVFTPRPPAKPVPLVALAQEEH
jgi:NADPH-dependent 2,4-dienoyl-CoA reductase/sulfur reductase-like enzyme